MDKIDFKKKHKDLYSPSSKEPSVVQVPQMQYAVLKGIGDPNTSTLFSAAIEALFGLSYTISMSYKGDNLIIPNFFNYVVPPLEGVWDIVDGVNYDKGNKNNLKWTIGILQPAFVTNDILESAKSIAIIKKKNNLIKDISLQKYNDGLCCTFMHIGPYDNEDISFAKMNEFIKENGFERIEKTHREIYLSDFRKVDSEKLKTILRFKVKKRIR